MPFPLAAAIIGASTLASGAMSRGNRNSQIPSIPQSQGFYSPLGDMRYENGDMYFRPRLSQNQKTTNRLQDQGLLRATRAINQPFNVNSMYNNAFYNNTLDMLNRPIQQQKAQDERELTNRLNAQNQLGSSFDAYQRNLMSQRHDSLFQDARNQARQASADAYQTQFNNALSALTGFRQDRNSAQDAAFMPTQMARYFR